MEPNDLVETLAQPSVSCDHAYLLLVVVQFASSMSLMVSWRWCPLERKSVWCRGGYYDQVEGRAGPNLYAKREVLP